MQRDLFSPAPNTLETISVPDADILYNQQFLSCDYADEVYQQLAKSLAWRQDLIKIYGKEMKIPRLQAWYGDDTAKYEYSGLLMIPHAWTPLLFDLKQQVELATGKQFNSVLANLYRSGNDSMGWHADNEKELGYQPTIGSLSLGQARDFDLRHVQTGKKIRLSLQNGSLLIMSGDTQTYWQHSIPKRVSKKHNSMLGRINLTFRKIML